MDSSEILIVESKFLFGTLEPQGDHYQKSNLQVEMVSQFCFRVNTQDYIYSESCQIYTNAEKRNDLTSAKVGDPFGAWSLTERKWHPSDCSRLKLPCEVGDHQLAGPFFFDLSLYFFPPLPPPYPNCPFRPNSSGPFFSLIRHGLLP